MQTELRLRFDYGHIVPWVRRVPGCLTAVSGPDAVRLARVFEPVDTGASPEADSATDPERL